MFLSIVIPTHKRPAQLQDCYNAVKRAVEICSIEFELIIISSAQDMKLPDKGEINLRFFVSSKVGVNFKRNLGIQLAQSEYILFLDDDVQVQTDFLLQLKKVIEAGTRNPIGGYYLNKPTANYWSRFYNWWANTWVKVHSGKVLLGGCMLFHKSYFTDELYFDEAIEYGGSETSLFLKKQSQDCLMKTEISVYHDLNLNLRSLIDKITRQNKGNLVPIQLSKKVLILRREILKDKDMIFALFVVSFFKWSARLLRKR